MNKNCFSQTLAQASHPLFPLIYTSIWYSNAVAIRTVYGIFFAYNSVHLELVCPSLNQPVISWKIFSKCSSGRQHLLKLLLLCNKFIKISSLKYLICYLTVSGDRNLDRKQEGAFSVLHSVWGLSWKDEKDGNIPQHSFTPMAGTGA